MTLPTYTFLPWMRRGAANAINRPYDPATDPDQADKGRATATVELVLGYEPVPGAPAVNPAAPPTVTRSVELLGPGDIRTLKPETILRVYPEANAPNATAGELAYVEFYEEDLPWRYTPAHPVNPAKLRPWLALLVLADGEFTVQTRTAEPSVLTVDSGQSLPPPGELWAWAHTQLAGEASAADAGQRVADDPNTAVSRLLSPRRLKPGVLYTAFLVPSFETGQRAGLGKAWADTPALNPSWDTGSTAPQQLPVYHSWSFTTGTSGTFEASVRKLVARPVGDAFGKRTVRFEVPGFGLDPQDLPSTFELEGALAPPSPGFTRAAYPDPMPGGTARDSLRDVLDQAGGLLDVDQVVPLDPGLVPPTYGRWHADLRQLSDVDDAITNSEAWVREVNLDPRQRAAAGLGAAIVRARQDDYLLRAWRQVGELRHANQRLREGELAVEAAQSMFDKHLSGADTDRALLMTAAAHRGIAATPPTGGAVPSVWSVLRASTVPSAVQDAAFARMTRPGRALVGGATVAEFQDGHLLEQLADGSLTAAPPVPTAAGSLSVADVMAALTADLDAAERAARTPGHVFWRLLVNALDAYSPTGALTLPPIPALQATLSAALGALRPPPDPAVFAAVKDLITAIDRLLPDGPWAARVILPKGPFVAAYGQQSPVGGNGVTIEPDDPEPVPPRPMPDPDQIRAFIDAFNNLVDRISKHQPAPTVPTPKQVLTDLASTVLGGLQPSVVLVDRILAALPGLPDPAAGLRRLRPVLAYPVFTEPMVEALRALDPDYILPNFGALPEDTLTVMAPNGRFIEALFAGLNTELARELLWREYPTDQRGSYFRVFWSHADAMSAQTMFDVEELHRWTPPLGTNATNAGTPIVLVMRSDLLRKFPRPLIYAQPAHRDKTTRIRSLDDGAAPIFPAFQATIDPDVTMFGFNLPGDPFTNGDDEGYYFVIKERAGQLRFGLDEHAPDNPVGDWDDLSWEHLPGVTDHLILATTPTQVPPVDPTRTGEPVWAGSAADMASILIRSQVMYARHAIDMLPGDDS